MRKCLLLVLVVLCVSCTSGRPVLMSCPDRHTPCGFEGLEQSLKEPGSTSHVIIVHGMGESNPGYSCGLVTFVSKELGLRQTSPAESIELHNAPNHPPSFIVVRTFGDANIPNRLRTYEVTWASITGALKHHLDYDSTDAKRRRRAVVNRLLKKNLMNDRLADPVIYLGALGEDIKCPVKYLLSKLFDREQTSQTCVPDDPNHKPLSIMQFTGTQRISFITYSLGSRVTYDSIGEVLGHSNSTSSTLEFVVSPRVKLHAFYMLANQLPLLELAQRNPFHTNTFEALGVAGLQSGDRFSVVAFNDPNDLLSYDLPEEFAAANPSVHFVNLSMPLARYLSVGVVNPLGAHTNHDSNRVVQDLLMRGASVPDTEGVLRRSPAIWTRKLNCPE